MGCKFCDDGYYPAVNVDGVVIHRTPPRWIVARVDVQGRYVVPVGASYKDGIEICTKRGLVVCLVAREK